MMDRSNSLRWPRPLAATHLALAFGAAFSALALQAQAQTHPHIRRWSFEATVIIVVNHGNVLVDVRRGDPVRGTVSFDSTAVEFFPGWYDHIGKFPVITTTVSNPRTGDEAQFRFLWGLGVGVWDDEPDWGGDDVIYFASQLGSPIGWPDEDNIIASVDFRATEAFAGSALPEAIELDDWDSARLDVFYDGDNRFVAEIHELTAADVPFIPGDFNGDEAVDGQDLGVWEYVYGWEDANLAADANLDNQVDGADFLTWQQHLGQSGPPNSGVPTPEPAAITPALAGIALLRRRGIRAAPLENGQ